MRRRRRSPDSLRGLRESRGVHRRLPDGGGRAVAVGARRRAVSRRRAHRGPRRVPTSTTPPSLCGCAHATVDLERPPPHPAPPASAFERLQTEPRSAWLSAKNSLAVARNPNRTPMCLRRSADPARVRARVRRSAPAWTPSRRRAAGGRVPDRRTGHACAGAAAPAPRPPGCRIRRRSEIRARPHARQRCAPPRGRRASRRRRMPRTARRCGVIRCPATPHRRRTCGRRRCGGPARRPARRTRRRNRPGPPRTPAALG